MKKLLFFLILSCSLSAQWDVVEIGQNPTDNSYEVALANGRNDGINRLYVTTAGGGLYEWTYDGANWTNTGILVSDVIGLSHVAIGAGRNDGVNRIYMVEFKKDVGRTREATWNGTSWDIVLIHEGLQSLGVILGDGRNDGMQRIYASSITGTNEFSWNGSNWDRLALTTETHEGVPDIGDGRNDGKNRIYIPATAGQESTYNNGFHNEYLDAEKNWPDALQIAPGRNDGINRIYVNNTAQGKGRIEYTWNGNGWDKDVIEGDTPQRGDIHVSRLHADGKYRVYMNWSTSFRTASGPLKEYEWMGNGWEETSTVVDAMSRATAMLASGVGRNDKVHRMYAAKGGSGGIYEITSTDPYVEINTSSRDLNELGANIYPNPAKEKLMHITFSTNDEDVIVSIISAEGKQIYSKLAQGNHLEINTEGWSAGNYMIKMITKTGKESVYNWIKL